MKKKPSVSKPPDHICLGEDGNERLYSAREIITICRCKHFRVGFEGMYNYTKLKTLLKIKGLKDEEIKQCLHP